MKAWLILLGTSALLGCAAAPPASTLAGGKACIAIDRIAGRYVVPPRSVMFEVAGPVNYRNELAGVCPGLERLGTTAVIELTDHTGGQLCPGDRIRVFDPVEAKATGSRAYPTCVLGSFTAVPRS